MTATASTTELGKITIDFTEVTGAERYELQSRRAGTVYQTSDFYNNSSGFPRTAVGLRNDTTYYFRVRAIGPLTTSSWSTEVSARTKMTAAQSATIQAAIDANATD